MEIIKCENCGLKFPARRVYCPGCDGRHAPVTPLTDNEMVARMSDVQVKHIFQQPIWEQGSQAARLACLVEYDKRFGLNNWPAHINKES